MRLRHSMALATGLALSAGLQAGVVSGAITGGSSAVFYLDGPSFVIASPGTVGPNSTEDFKTRGWNEKQNYTLGAALAVDFLAATGMPGMLPAGKRVDSHGMHIDPANGILPQRNFIGHVVFSRPVIAVISSEELLDASDFLGDPGTTYLSFPHRGLEVSDVFWLSMDGKTLHFDFTARNPGDNIRVLTLVPEPATWAMLVAGFGLVGFAVRRSRRSVARMAA